MLSLAAIVSNGVNMFRKLILSYFMLLISFESQASKRELSDDEFNADFFAQLDRAVAEHQAAKKPKAPEDDIDTFYSSDVIAQIDRITQAYLDNAEARPPEAAPVAVGTPSTVLASKHHAIRRPHHEHRSVRKLYDEQEHLNPQAPRPVMISVENEDTIIDAQPPAEFSHVINPGTMLKFLTNAYKGSLKENSNIFLPRYTIQYMGPDGQMITEQDYFRTPKGQLVVFASGGSANMWEKTVAKVYHLFTGVGVKVIRAHWLQKHLKRRNVHEFCIEDYEGRETDLHSELYYDLFFRHIFNEQLSSNTRQINRLVVDAFSWWEVCDTCEKHFVSHQDVCRQWGIQNFFCRVAAAKRYPHSYEDSVIQRFDIPGNDEEEVWRAIWLKLIEFTNLHSYDAEARHHFWTKTAEGLELCKWIGQAFVENPYALDDRKVDPDERGDLLKYFSKFEADAIEENQQADITRFQQLILDLSDMNWDLSCWFKGRYIATTQFNWKKYSSQQVMPHFGWIELDNYRDETGSSQCQMCGQKNLVDIYLVYHPKYKVSAKLLTEEEAEQENSDVDVYTVGSDDEAIHVLPGQRRRALEVGSECVQLMGMDKTTIKEWRTKNPLEVTEFIQEEKSTMLGHYDELDRVAAEETYQAIKSICEKNEGVATTRKIGKILEQSAKEFKPFIEILLANGRIESAGRGAYKMVVQ
jgi:hypothetical protein